MYGYSVDLEYAHVTDLPDLMRVQQLHLACALIEIVAQGDAVAPALVLLAKHSPLPVDEPHRPRLPKTRARERRTAAAARDALRSTPITVFVMRIPCE